MAVLTNETKNKILIPDLKIADSFVSRGLGLIPRKSIAAAEGLLITRCKSISMFFMSFPIDCVFVDKKLKVVAMVQEIKPWRISAIYWRADAAIEIQAGSVRRLGIELGDQLHVGH